MSNKPIKDMKNTAEEVYLIVKNWPFHLLDQVKASGVDMALESMVFTVSELYRRGGVVDSFMLSATARELRGLKAWITTNNTEGVMLRDADKALKGIGELVKTFESTAMELAMQEKRDIYSPADDENELEEL